MYSRSGVYIKCICFVVRGIYVDPILDLRYICDKKYEI